MARRPGQNQSPAFRAKVIMAALKGDKTTSGLMTLLLAASICLASVPQASAMGDPLINLRRFFTDLFRVQIDGAEIILRGSDISLDTIPPADPERRSALRPVQEFGRLPSVFTCDDIRILGYSDWQEGSQRAREARRRAEGNRRTPEMYWPNFWDWNSPVFVSVDARRTLWGNLGSAQVSIAVLGSEFHISSILDQSQNRIHDAALEQLFRVSGWGYESLFTFQLQDKEITLFETVECDEFLIFQLRVR